MRDAGVYDQQWDCILCTSLLPVGEIRGLLPPAMRSIPLVMVVHENQVAYPAGATGADARDLHAPVTDLVALAGADAVIFTSQWNRQSCLEGLASVLDASPARGLSGTLKAIESKSHVCWPPVEDPVAETNRGGIEHKPDNNGRSEDGDHRPVVCWPHRHQHDKGPDDLIACDQACDGRLRWVLLGERRGPEPPGLAAFRALAGGRIIHDGYCDRAMYLQWLARSDWVCSTATHEFFGIAVVEALLSGCLPWLPGRLSYPELVPAQWHGLTPAAPPQAESSDQIRADIRSHLGPAIAPEAVRRLEALLQAAVCTRH